MFNVKSILFCLGICSLGTLLSLALGGLIYDYDSVGPYKDTGFAIFPDWSDDPSINTIFAIAHCVLHVILFLLHVHRIPILRRMCFLFGVSQLMQLVQSIVTQFPGPNPAHPIRMWTYTSFQSQYVLSALFLQFYFPALWVRVLSWCLGVFGMLLLIPTRMFYTVDVICGSFPPVLCFLLGHWFCRNSVSILKRQWVYWLERDVLVVADKVQTSNRGRSRSREKNWNPYRPVEGAATNGSQPNAVQATTEESRESTRVHQSPAEEDQWRHEFPTSPAPPPVCSGALFSWMDLFALNTGEYKLYNPKALFWATDGRGPSRATLHQEDTVRYVLSHDFDENTSVTARTTQNEMLRDEDYCAFEELVLRADRLSEKRRIYGPPLIALASCIVGGSVGLLNLISVHIGDEYRPLHIPLPSDILHSIFSPLPDHAADIILYPMTVFCFFFAILSRFRYTILRRSAMLYGISMIGRIFTIPSTFPPDPSPNCAERTHAWGTTCGDLIYSGHTVAFLLGAFIIRYWTREPMWELLCWIFTVVGLFTVVVSRLHYTRDVLSAFIVVISVNHILRTMLFKRVSFLLENDIAWCLECDYYVVVAEERRAEREGRIATHDWVGRFKRWYYENRHSARLSSETINGGGSTSSAQVSSPDALAESEVRVQLEGAPSSPQPTR
jgi:hypothetical protein